MNLVAQCGWVGVGLVIKRSLVRLPAGVLASQLGQLSLPSLWGRKIEYQPAWLGLGGARSLVSGGNKHCVISHMASDMEYFY